MNQTLVRLRYTLYVATVAMLAAVAIRSPLRKQVHVIVVDSGSALMPTAQAQLSTFKDIAHGDIVKRIIESEAPSATVTLVPVDGPSGAIDRDLYLTALRRVLVQKLDGSLDKVVVNVSMGSTARDPEEEHLIHRLISAGVVVVAAAGNDGGQIECFPACYEGVIAVAAADGEGLASYSNWGRRVTIAASGSFSDEHIVGTGDSNVSETINLSGTSFAAPRVSGICADLIALAGTQDSQPTQVMRMTASRIIDDRTKRYNLDMALVNGHAARAAINSTYWYSLSVELWVALIIALAVAAGTTAFCTSDPGNSKVLSREASLIAMGLAACGAVALYMAIGYAFDDKDTLAGILAAVIITSGFSAVGAVKVTEAVYNGRKNPATQTGENELESEHAELG